MLRSLELFTSQLLAWYDSARRDLPWRISSAAHGRPDPYHVLVSELMLQQTQVATVIPYFHRFLTAFPTVGQLAKADEQDVLRLWQGLGYYSRARNLHRAAKDVVGQFAGAIPGDVTALLTLPGVGRYTAGAVASIAFAQPAPILDGNVTRVLCRIDCITDDPRDRLILQKLWARAAEILPAVRVGDFNSALMELGAMVCTPRSPKCLLCPVREHCNAQAAGLQEQIPRAKKAKPTPIERRMVLCIARGSRWLIEQRPANGRWAGMWQFFTRESPKRGTIEAPVRIGPIRRVGKIEHQLTHRHYKFDVRRCEAEDTAAAEIVHPHAWVSLSGLGEYPLPNPHLRIARMLSDQDGK